MWIYKTKYDTEIEGQAYGVIIVLSTCMYINYYSGAVGGIHN